MLLLAQTPVGGQQQQGKVYGHGQQWHGCLAFTAWCCSVLRCGVLRCGHPHLCSTTASKPTLVGAVVGATCSTVAATCCSRSCTAGG